MRICTVALFGSPRIRRSCRWGLTVRAVVDVRHHRTVVGGLQGVAAADAHRRQPLVVRGQEPPLPVTVKMPHSRVIRTEHLHHPPLAPAALHAGDGDESTVSLRTAPAQVQGGR